MHRRIKNWFIFHAARIAISIAGFIPSGFAAAAGRWLGAAAHAIARRERRLAQSHLAMAFDQPVSGPRIRLLARGVFVHFWRPTTDRLPLPGHLSSSILLSRSRHIIIHLSLVACETVEDYVTVR